MVLIEEIAEEHFPTEEIDPESPSNDIATVLDELSARLALPADLLPKFLHESKSDSETITAYKSQSESTLRAILSRTAEPTWPALSVEEHAAVIANIVPLHGEDDWTSPTLCNLVDSIVATIDAPAVAVYLLTHSLRTLFSAPHPSLNPSSSRALARPAGGPDAMSDLHDSGAQVWKTAAGWGCHNALRWCVVQLDSSALEHRIGVVLPPTLVMMDDWEPAWRGRGAWVLSSWVGRVDTSMLSRMGVDKLLLASLTHSLSLHANPPLKHVLPAALELAGRLDGARRAESITDIVDKSLVQGWLYAPSGLEGRPVLIDIAQNLEVMCCVLGTGIVRWLKTIIPSLLDPLQYTPSPAVLPHFEANLSALSTLLVTLRDTDRLPRWRGQILDILARLWVQISERTYDVSTQPLAGTVKSRVRDVFSELERQCPSIRNAEYPVLLALNAPIFASLLSPSQS